MKVFAFLFVAIFLVAGTTSTSPEDMAKDLQKWLEECCTELDFPMEKLDAYFSMEKPIDDEKAECVMACFYEKAGFLKDNKLKGGQLSLFLEIEKDKERIKQLQEASDKCEEEASHKEERCAIAGTFTKCALAKIKSLQDQ